MDDEALVAGLLTSREEAVQEFLRRYRTLMQHCISQFATESGAREDLFQDLFAYLLERLRRDSFQAERGSLGTWLYRVTWCRCVDLKRRENAGRRPPTQTSSEPIPDPIDPGRGPADHAGFSEVGELVRSALEELKTEESELLRLRHVEELTLVEIAAIRSQSLESVKYRLKRAQQLLRSRILSRATDTELVE